MFTSFLFKTSGIVLYSSFGVAFDCSTRYALTFVITISEQLHASLHNMTTHHHRPYLALSTDLLYVLLIFYITSFVTVIALPIPQSLGHELFSGGLDYITKSDVNETFFSSSNVSEEPFSTLRDKKVIAARELGESNTEEDYKPRSLRAGEGDGKETYHVISARRVLIPRPPSLGEEREITLTQEIIVGVTVPCGVFLCWALSLYSCMRGTKDLTISYFLFNVFFCCFCISDDKCFKKRKKKNVKGGGDRYLEPSTRYKGTRGTGLGPRAKTSSTAMAATTEALQPQSQPEAHRDAQAPREANRTKFEEDNRKRIQELVRNYLEPSPAVTDSIRYNAIHPNSDMQPTRTTR